MVSFVLDTSAVPRSLDQEAGAGRIAQGLEQHYLGTAQALISAMHRGEIVGVFLKRHDSERAHNNIARLRALGLTVIPVTAERAERCAKLKVDPKIPYVDALAIELTVTTPECTLITADFDVKPAEHLVSIQFLPTKSKRSE